MSPLWPTASISEIAPLVRRPVLPKDDKLYRQIGLRSYGKGVFHKAPMTGLEIGSKRVFNVEPGDLLFNIVFAWEGAIAVATEAEQGMIGSHRFLTCVADNTKADAKFLCYWFTHREGRERLLQASPGGAGRNRTLGVDKLAAIQIPLPPLQEQRRIVARIEELCGKVKEAEGCRDLAHSETKLLWQRSARERLLSLSNSASQRPLSELVELRGGGTPDKREPRFWHGDIPWITPKDMKRRMLSDAIDHISEEATKQSSAKLLQAGAVLVVVRGMILAHTFPVAVLRAPATINQDMKALIPCAEVDAAYLCTALWALNSDVLELVDRSSHDTRKLMTDKLRALRIPVPSLKEQRAIVAELDALQSKVEAVMALQAKAALELDAMLPAILDEAFKGEL
jgi:type I restriction enzyme, S subunit